MTDDLWGSVREREPARDLSEGGGSMRANMDGIVQEDL